MSKMKKCSTCKEMFPATQEYFHANRTCWDGLQSECKPCVLKRRKRYNLENKKSISEHNKQYYQKNKDAILQQKQDNKENIKVWRKQYLIRTSEYRHQKYMNNRDVILRRNKEYRQRNKVSIAERSKQYRLANKEAIALMKRKYQEDNRETINERKRQYYRENWDAFRRYRIANKDAIVRRNRIYFHNRRAIMRRLPHTLTVDQWENIKHDFGNKCAYCGKELPLEQDHFVPLKKGGEYSHNNIIPSCKSCNSSKGDKNFPEWYQRQIFYNKSNELRIFRYLGYKNNRQQLSIF